MWRIVGIAADPNRRDPGGKGKFSVGGRKRDDARRGIEPQRREKDRATSALNSDLAMCQFLHQ
ncbi:hypothetical protein MUTS15_13080 [Escherichia coli]|nr:hypothetical protein [Escherichia coli]BDY92651.1 hypothetical protein MUTS15_13080 [Escherichia coli]BDZ01229.1 hypothetical protein MUTS16_23020 [Escherichia coli]